MFDWQGWIERFKAEPGYNDAAGYGVVTVSPTLPIFWRVIGIHHLTPAENRGNHNLFVDVLDKNGSRTDGATVQWVWEGMRLEEKPAPLKIDKPAGEIPDIPMGFGQKIRVWMGDNSDLAGQFHTNHQDEHGPGGEVWNSIGHHSFLVVFQEVGDSPPPDTGQAKVVGKITLNYEAVSSLEPDEDGNVILDIAIEAK